MVIVVEVSVELKRIDGRVCGWRVAEEEFPVDVVFQDVASGAGLVRVSSTGLGEASGLCICEEEFLTGWDTGATLLGGSCVDLDAIYLLQERLWDALRHERCRPGEFAQLVYGQDAVANELGFGGGEVGEDKAWAIA